MDHEIQDYGNISSPGIELRQAMRFDEHRALEEKVPLRGTPIEALAMSPPHLHIRLLCNLHQLPGLLQRCHNRFLNEYMTVLAQSLDAHSKCETVGVTISTTSTE